MLYNKCVSVEMSSKKQLTVVIYFTCNLYLCVKRIIFKIRADRKKLIRQTNKENDDDNVN